MAGETCCLGVLRPRERGKERQIRQVLARPLDDPPQAAEDASLEVDERADDVEGQDPPVGQGHHGFVYHGFEDASCAVFEKSSAMT